MQTQTLPPALTASKAKDHRPVVFFSCSCRLADFLLLARQAQNQAQRQPATCPVFSF
jgi:hypothetical protein